MDEGKRGEGGGSDEKERNRGRPHRNLHVPHLSSDELELPLTPRPPSSLTPLVPRAFVFDSVRFDTPSFARVYTRTYRWRDKSIPHRREFMHESGLLPCTNFSSLFWRLRRRRRRRRRQSRLGRIVHSHYNSYNVRRAQICYRNCYSNMSF